MPRPVNFVRLDSPNYNKVQDQIFGLIRAALGDHPVSETVNEKREEAINFGLFIRMGRFEQSSPMPIDVLMSHGLADKNYLLARDASTKQRLVNVYEHILVPGSWFLERLRRYRFHPIPSRRVRLRAGQIHIVGWPRLDAAIGREAIVSDIQERRRRLLWAPSHNISRRKDSFSSYPAFEQFLPALEETFDVRVSLHPSNRTEKSPTAGDLDWADVVVSDFGTLLYEAFALNKCVIMPTWLLPDTIGKGLGQRASAEGHIYANRVGNHARSFEELVTMAKRNEPPDLRVQSLMNRILEPEYRGHSARRIADLLKSLPLKRHGARAAV